MQIRVGTCGWQYDDWRSAVCPPGLGKQHWLDAYADMFDTVECDNAFYRLPEKGTFQKWAGQLPDGFVMAVKASRFLTHVKRLNDPAEPVQRLMDRCDGLSDRLGPVLLQLPPTLRVDRGKLEATLACFPPTTRVAVEPRHDSWFTDDVRSVLSDRGAALVWLDRRGKMLAPLWQTASWAYVRLHEGVAAPRPSYGDAALRAWLRRIDESFTGDGEVFCYFNNDRGAAAVRNAVALRRICAQPSRALQ